MSENKTTQNRSSNRSSNKNNTPRPRSLSDTSHSYSRYSKLLKNIPLVLSKRFQDKVSSAGAEASITIQNGVHQQTNTADNRMVKLSDIKKLARKSTGGLSKRLSFRFNSEGSGIPEVSEAPEVPVVPEKVNTEIIPQTSSAKAANQSSEPLQQKESCVSDKTLDKEEVRERDLERAYLAKQADSWSNIIHESKHHNSQGKSTWLANFFAACNAIGGGSGFFFGIWVVLTHFAFFTGMVQVGVIVALFLQTCIMIRQNYFKYHNSIVSLFEDNADSIHKVQLEQIPEHLTQDDAAKSSWIHMVTIIGSLAKSILGGFGVVSIFAALALVTGIHVSLYIIVPTALVIWACGFFCTFSLEGKKTQENQAVHNKLRAVQEFSIKKLNVLASVTNYLETLFKKELLGQTEDNSQPKAKQGQEVEVLPQPKHDVEIDPDVSAFKKFVPAIKSFLASNDVEQQAQARALLNNNFSFLASFIRSLMQEYSIVHQIQAYLKDSSSLIKGQALIASQDDILAKLTEQQSNLEDQRLSFYAEIKQQLEKTTTDVSKQHPIYQFFKPVLETDSKNFYIDRLTVEAANIYSEGDEQNNSQKVFEWLEAKRKILLQQNKSLALAALIQLYDQEHAEKEQKKNTDWGKYLATGLIVAFAAYNALGAFAGQFFGTFKLLGTFLPFLSAPLTVLVAVGLGIIIWNQNFNTYLRPIKNLFSTKETENKAQKIKYNLSSNTKAKNWSVYVTISLGVVAKALKAAVSTYGSVLTLLTFVALTSFAGLSLTIGMMAAGLMFLCCGFATVALQGKRVKEKTQLDNTYKTGMCIVHQNSSRYLKYQLENRKVLLENRFLIQNTLKLKQQRKSNPNFKLTENQELNIKLLAGMETNIKFNLESVEQVKKSLGGMYSAAFAVLNDESIKALYDQHKEKLDKETVALMEQITTKYQPIEDELYKSEIQLVSNAENKNNVSDNQPQQPNRVVGSAILNSFAQSDKTDTLQDNATNGSEASIVQQQLWKPVQQFNKVIG